MKLYYQLIFAISALLFTYDPAFCQSKKSDKFIGEYADVALWTVGKKRQPLMKWGESDTIRYRIYGNLRYMNQQEWDIYVAEIAELIGKTIIPTNQRDFDIIMFFGTLRDYADFTGVNVGSKGGTIYGAWGDRRWNEQYELTYASACIDPSRLKSNISGVFLVKQQFLRTLGLLGGIENQYSIFNTRGFDNNKSLSKKDRQYIRLHYTNDVKAGLSRNDLIKAVKEIRNLNTFIK